MARRQFDARTHLSSIFSSLDSVSSGLALVEKENVALTLLQCVLLDRLSGDVRSLDEELLGELLASKNALLDLLLSGGCRNWRSAVEFMCRVRPWTCDATRFDLRIATAAALCHADEETNTDMQENPIDYFARHANFKRWFDEGKLFAGFDSLTTWHLRYVLGSWHEDSCLEWARLNVDETLRSNCKIGGAAHMVTYKLHNDNGVSVQRGLAFYDGKKSTMPVIKAYGGVCGAVSKFGTSCCQAFGVPAMPVAQPGHCAMMWRRPEGDWEVTNDCGGLGQSRMHAKIQRTWQRELGENAENAAVICAMEGAQSNFENYARSELLLWSSRFALKPTVSTGLLVESIAACPYNIPAWGELPAKLSVSNSRCIFEQLEGQVVAAENRFGPSRLDLSLRRPVLSSVDQDRARNVVDGTSSEWFPDSCDPQWLVIDLQRPCEVNCVQVQWWGDYGKHTRLRVSSIESSNSPSEFRCHRTTDADFNGWSEFDGWGGTTRFVRLDLDGPHPDCFGLGKQYGMRQVRVLGISHQKRTDTNSLIDRWIDASFRSTRQVDVQSLVLSKCIYNSADQALHGQKHDASESASSDCQHDAPGGCWHVFRRLGHRILGFDA